jgi:DNA-directed RNA polymerase sigma subunit (sigma70/sigma32)
MTTLHKNLNQAEKDCLTLQEIASMMNLSRERVRQIKAKALIKLRKKFQAAQLTPSDLYGDALRALNNLFKNSKNF